MMDTTTALSYYKDLLIAQYADKPKARAHVEALVDCALADLLAVHVGEAFSLDSAGGPQLDILGEYIGFDRTIMGEVPRDYMTAADYTTYNPAAPVTGMTDYTDLTINAGSALYRYQFASESYSDLSDDEYRYMLKLKVALNNCDNTLYSIQQIIAQFLGSDIVIYDLGQMVISYAVKTTAGVFIQIAATQGLLPKPIGVAIAGVFKFPDPLTVWGLQDYVYEMGNTTGMSDYLTGWSGRHWLSYNDAI